jgi:acylphosphatase
MSESIARRLVLVGRVQGVGFRSWAVDTALDLGLRGWVRNRRDGSVEILAIGPAERLDAFALACGSGPPSARVGAVESAPAEDDGVRGFERRDTG